MQLAAATAWQAQAVVPAYRLSILPLVYERVRHLAPELKRSIRQAIRAIAQDPLKGEPLRRELRDYLKYKVRRFRIVYRVARGARKVTIMAVGHRRTIYEEFAASIRTRDGG